jgi:hypothetical protein
LLLPNIVELLLNKRANIDDQDEIGLTPLMLGKINLTRIFIIFNI